MFCGISFILLYLIQIFHQNHLPLAAFLNFRSTAFLQFSDYSHEKIFIFRVNTECDLIQTVSPIRQFIQSITMVKILAWMNLPEY